MKTDVARQHIDIALGSAIFGPSLMASKSAGAQSALQAFVEAAKAARDMLTEDNALSLTEALRKGTGQQLLDGVLRWKKKLKTAPGGPIFALEDREGLVEHTIIATLDLAMAKLGEPR